MATTATPTVGATSQGLSSWAGPYVTDMLGKANAISDEPYQTYGGPLTAGASDLQNQAFQNAGNMGNYSPTQFSSGIFDTQAAQQYMNPYLQAALQPQTDEARRQSQITGAQNDTRAVQAGAFGGSRQALMSAENQRNLGTNLANITGQGYNTAYNNAQQQFNADQSRNMTAQQNTEQSKQFGAQQGINNLNTQMQLGGVQRGIEQEGVAADLNEFNQQRDDPMKKVQFLSSMVQGLPISTSTNSAAPQSNLAAFSGGAKTGADLLAALGIT